MDETDAGIDSGNSQQIGQRPGLQSQSWMRRMMNVWQVIRGNILLRLRDKLGVTRLVFLDSDGVEIGWINSLGVVTFAGTLTTNSSVGGASSGLYSSGVVPGLGLNVTGAAVDNQIWDIVATAPNTMLFRIVNTASNAAVAFMGVVRSGMIVTSVTLAATTVTLAATTINLTGLVVATPPAWVTPTLGNSWVAFGAPYGTAQYCIDAQGFVHLRGLIKSGTLVTNIFVLPAGFRPTVQMLFEVNSNSASGTLIIYTTGAVQLQTGNNTFLSLDSVTFPTN